MSIIHGQIDEELVKHTLRVFDLEVEAGWPVERESVGPNT
jgi:hypothetical protein